MKKLNADDHIEQFARELTIRMNMPPDSWMLQRDFIERIWLRAILVSGELVQDHHDNARQ